MKLSDATQPVSLVKGDVGDGLLGEASWKGGKAFSEQNQQRRSPPHAKTGEVRFDRGSGVESFKEQSRGLQLVCLK
jgi:hypothetical protein